MYRAMSDELWGMSVVRARGKACVRACVRVRECKCRYVRACVTPDLPDVRGTADWDSDHAGHDGQRGREAVWGAGSTRRSPSRCRCVAGGGVVLCGGGVR